MFPKLFINIKHENANEYTNKQDEEMGIVHTPSGVGGVDVGGGVMVNGIFIPAMPKGWKKGDPIPSASMTAMKKAAMPPPSSVPALAAVAAAGAAAGLALPRPPPQLQPQQQQEGGEKAARRPPSVVDALDLILNPELERVDYDDEYSDSDEEDDDEGDEYEEDDEEAE